MSPRDFLEDNQQNMPSIEMNAGSPRDFLEEPQKESLGTSLGYAIPRILNDAGQGIYHAAQSIPNYWEKSKTEVPALLNPYSQWREHPLHVAGQGLAGINEAINAVAQFPLNVAKYGSNRLNLLPQSVTNALQKITPEDTTQAINQLFDQPQYAGEAALRGTTRNILPIAGITKLAQAAPNLTKRGATRTLNKARKLAADREIGTLNVNPELIEDARQFLPNTLPHRNALEAAQYGDYDNLFRLQSDVGKNAGDYAKSFFSAAERSHGRAGLEARNRLLDAIHENLQSQGHNDISSLLRQGQNDYRRYMAFKPYRNILGLAGLGMLLPKNSLTNVANKILSHRTQ